MGFLDFLTEGKAPQAVPVSSTEQSVLPDWYTNYAMDILTNQQAIANRAFPLYQGPRIADFTPDQQAGFQATRENAFGFRPELDTASQQTQGTFGRSALGAAQPLMGQAAGMSGLGAAQPFFNQATGMSGVNAADPRLQQGAGVLAQSTDALGVQMAQPYLGAAGQTAPQVVGQYMNPYTDQVVNRIGQMGTRALKEQILPGIEGEMIRAGQFGGTRQAELTGRAIRDATEGISAQQAQALQQGYGQAQQAAQTDLARQGQLASVAGGLGGAQQQALLGAGRGFADIGQTYGALTQAQQQLLSDVGKSSGTLTQGQQQLLSELSGRTGQFYGADTEAQLRAAAQTAQLGQQRQQQEMAGAGALQQVGAAQQGQTQRNLDLAYQDFLQQQGFPQEQVKGMIGALQGVAPAVPKGATKVGTEVPGAMSPSLLASLGSTFATIKGFENLFGGP